MAEAFVDGVPVAAAQAAATAAELLAASRLPVIAGLLTDVAGARAALALAERVGGVVDHAHSEALLGDLEVMGQAGTLVSTPVAAAQAADTLLLVGPGLQQAWPELVRELIARAPDPRFLKGPRRIYWLCPGAEIAGLAGRAVGIGGDARALPGLLGALRAQLKGRSGAAARGELADLAGALAAAGYGVAVWSCAQLEALSVEMLYGLIDDLNTATRFSALPLAPGDNAIGVLAVCGWTTGLPLRTSFARASPEHDPWRFAASRLIESGESDCALWICAHRQLEPAWQREVPVIVLAGAQAQFSSRPRVRINVGRPGHDHDSVEFCPGLGALVAITAAQKTAAISVAQAIALIARALPEARAC